MRGQERRGTGGGLGLGLRPGAGVRIRIGAGGRRSLHGPCLRARSRLPVGLLRVTGRAHDPGGGGAPAPTRLTVAVDTRGGRLALVRGGAAQEFTVTLRNGNSAEYRHLLVAFQMELLVGEPGDRPGSGPGFLLERFDQASGAWRPAEFRIANDVKPLSLFTGGGPLARETVRVERYRLRATAGGPTGSSPVVVSFIDTDADRVAAAHVVLGHATR